MARFYATQDPREFFKHVSPSGCWEWNGGRDQDGYGQTRTGMKRVKAHRKAWELLNGPIADGLLVCHYCDNPSCVRPDHLYIGTHADNQHDKWARGRGVCRSGSVRLTRGQVLEIRERYATGTIRQRELADEYGVTQTTISRVVHKDGWSTRR